MLIVMDGVVSPRGIVRGDGLHRGRVYDHWNWTEAERRVGVGAGALLGRINKQTEVNTGGECVADSGYRATAGDLATSS